MTKREKITLVSVIIVFAVVMIAIFWDYVTYAAHKAKEMTGGSSLLPDTEPANSIANKPTNTSTSSWNKLLKKGVYDSEEVKLLQKLLNQVQPWDVLNVDGDFGPATESRLFSITGKKQITLQEAYNLLQKMFQ